MSAHLLDVRYGLRNLVKHHIIISGIVFLCVIVAAFVAVQRTPPKFRTTAKLLVLLSDDYAAKPVPGSGATFLQTALDRDAYMSAESDILVSDVVIDRTIQDIGAEILYSDAGKSPGLIKSTLQAIAGFISGFRLQENDPAKLASINAHIAVVKSLQVDIGHSGNVITVSYANPNRHMSARFVSALIDNYFARRASLFADDQSVTLGQQVESKGKELEMARVSLTKFQQTYSISDFALQRQLLVKRLADLLQDAQAAEADGDEARSRHDTVLAQLNALPPAFVRQVNGTKIVVRNGNVAMTLQEEANKLEQAFNAASVRRQGLEGRIASVQVELEKLNEHEGQLNDLKLRLDVLARQYSQGLQALYERKSVEAVAQSWRSNVKLLDKVQIPTAPTSQRMLIAATGVLLALFAGGSILALGLFFTRRRKGEDDRSAAIFNQIRMRVSVGAPHAPKEP